MKKKTKIYLEIYHKLNLVEQKLFHFERIASCYRRHCLHKFVVSLNKKYR